jgi:hypothetical protein
MRRLNTEDFSGFIIFDLAESHAKCLSVVGCFESSALADCPAKNSNTNTIETDLMLAST